VKAYFFDADVELEGWSFFWAGLELTGSGTDELAALSSAVCARERADASELPSRPAVARMRSLFRAAGTDPTRYRPSSEALLRRIRKGEDIPAIHPFVDLNNCLSAELAVPCCVMTDGTFEAPFVFRAGRAGEAYESLRGPFNLEGKPLLCDAHGPLDSPITGNVKVKVSGETTSAWYVAYLPAGIVTPERVGMTLARMLDEAPVARILWTREG
jgi:DNA/RNA-binding domain of Phe-tRNA-synthetase-like protein